MKMYFKNLWVFACLALFATTGALAQSVAPPPVQTSPAGVRYVIGGVGDDERKAMRTAYHHFKLRIDTAEKGGAYTADMQVKLSNAQGQTLLDVLVDGPWLLVDVPRGEYQIEVRKDGGQHSQKIKLGGEAQQQVLFMWPAK